MYSDRQYPPFYGSDGEYWNFKNQILQKVYELFDIGINLIVSVYKHYITMHVYVLFNFSSMLISK